MRNRAAIAVLCVLAPFAVGCVSQAQHRQMVEERDAEIRALREERTQLKNKLRDMEYQRDSLETALAEANSRALEPRVEEAAAPQSFPELDRLGISYGSRDGNLVISIPSEITFDSGKAEITSGGRTALKVVADTLKGQYGDAHYWIEGHTDTDPIRKSAYPTNRDLSIARAMRVLYFLVEDAGIADDRCVVVGWGQYDPVASNDTPAGKAKNRRVEIVVRRGA